MAVKNRFAGYPAAVAFTNPDGKTAVGQLRWGQFVLDMDERKGSYTAKDVHGNQVSGKYVKARIRGHKGDCWIREHEIQNDRLLEAIFIDIGQGDGCLLVTPKDKKIVIDAGEGDNMFRFLRWRFGKFSKKFTFESAVISHPDADHYKGFTPFFDNEKVFFETIYHNGIMERFGKNPLGSKKTVGGRKFLTDLITSKTQFKNWLSVRSRWKSTKNGRTSFKQYPKMLRDALVKKRFGKFTMLSQEDEFMPGYGPDQDLSIQVLGPVVEKKSGNKPMLRWLSSVGKTKNGHSVVLRAQYHDVSILLGGDLNIPAEDLLLSHHTGLSSPASSADDEEALVSAAREVFQVDIAKACHHGSSDFSSVYLKATNPIATVISSGDNEPHSHPRADALGTIGVCSRRGGRPLIFSTELARSSKESIKHPHVLKRDLFGQLDAIKKAPAKTPAEKKKKNKQVADFEEQLDKVLDRSVAVFGAISVVTDGFKVIVAQKLERARSRKHMWDIYRLEAEGNGPLRYQSKH